MASLREIKDRIGSVRSTLKITSAMKLVASAKLRKAQRAIEAMRPYERTLAEILAAIGPAAESSRRAAGNYFSDKFAEKPISAPLSAADPGKLLSSPSATERTAVVAIASNSSLCGGFNGNAVRKALETIRSCEGEVEVYPVGRKMADGLRRAGYAAQGDWNDLIGHPSYEKSVALARSLSERFEAGELSRVVLVYNRFRSASSQEPVAEQYLPFAATEGAKDEILRQDQEDKVEYILEPDAEALIAQLLPQVMMLKFHAAILDSAAAEQAARTIAMQTASDNAEDLLGELTLEYNKGRQQKITSEILDLLGGAQ
ncbi:MAG: ATP synthase F1 subunit gamma [Bacteroidales bacterium]|nr:ATP synthase F1 subunit gamma [Bacteroidales bacterium]